MPHRMLRSAATVLLASAPLLAAVPAQAAQATQQNFPCTVGFEEVDNSQDRTVAITVQCDEERTLGVRISAGDTEFVNVEQTVQAGVQQTITITVPRAPRPLICATLEADGESARVCTS
ncbi:hypothetical protein [Streptomyces flaveus]|uniref:hypothetical protein n=1 Tax=Streptomyces flaveus TaxID=66370 RepID=UPI0033190AF7